MGVRQARSERALAEGLRRDRLVLMRTWRLPGWLTPERRLKTKDHAELNAQLAQLLSRGVPLVETLEVAATVVSPSARPRVERIREMVASGSSFADACQAVGSFDRASIAVYRAAEQTGDLAGGAGELAEAARRQLALSGKAGTLLIYPCIVLTVGFLVSAAMLMFFVPRIGDALMDLQVDLPGYTVVLIGLGGWMHEQWMLLLTGLLVVFAGLVIGRRAVGAMVSRLSRRAPLIRDVVLAQESSRFFSVMSAMTRTGVPLADALGVGTETIGHPTLRRELSTLRTKLIEGGVLRNLIDGVSSLPQATRRLLIAADRAGDLETAFQGLADDLAEETDRRAARLLAAFGPALLVFVFLVIGGLLLAIMVPLINATGDVF